MTIASLGSRGTSSATTGASFTTMTVSLVNGSIDASAGRHLILDISFDNLSTADGASSDVLSVTGGTGTWTKIAEYSNGNGAAAGGAAASTWLFTPSGANALGTVFTVTFSGSINEAALRLWGYSTDVGNALRLVGSPVMASQDGASNFNSNSVSGLTSKQYLFRSTYSKEANSTAALTVSSSFTAIGTTRSRNVATAIMLAGEFRIATLTGVTSNPTHAVTGDSVSILSVYEEYTPSGSQSLALPLLTRSRALHAPTLTTGPVGLALPLLTHAKTLYAPALASGASLDLPLLTRSRTLYAPVLTVGAVTVSLPLSIRAKTLHAPMLAPGPVALSLPLLTRPRALYAPLLAVGGVAVSLPLLTRGRTLFGPSLTPGPVGLALPLLVRAKAMHAPVLTTGPVTIALPLLTLGKTMYPPSLTSGGSDIALPLLTRARTLYAPTVTAGAVALSLPLIDRPKTQYAPALVPASVTIAIPLLIRTRAAYAPSLSIVSAVRIYWGRRAAGDYYLGRRDAADRDRGPRPLA